MSNPSDQGLGQTSAVLVRLEVLDPGEASCAAFELAGRLNLPHWPPVDIIASGPVISCRSLTWEPLLRARIEEAIEAWLGHRWPESVGFI
jgi:hypothetical protein